MVIVGGSSSRYYRCGDAHKRGTCANRLPLREAIISEALFREIRRQLVNPAGLAYAREQIAKRIGDATRSRDADRKRLSDEVAGIGAKLEKLVDLVLATDGAPGALLERMRELEAKKAATSAELARLTAAKPDALPLPSPSEIEAAVFDLETHIREAPVEAREALRRYLRDGRVMLTPQEDGTYLAEAELLPMMVIEAAELKSKKPRNHLDSEASPAADQEGRIQQSLRG